MRTPGSTAPGSSRIGHHERVHAVALARRSRAGRTPPPAGVPGGVADVVLARLVVGVVITNSPVAGVVGRHRAERLHVAAVPGLGHREAAEQLAGDQVGEVGVVVALRAELEDRAAEQAELDAGLHQQGQVAEGQRLERRDGGADVAAAAVLLGEAHPGLPGRGHLERAGRGRGRGTRRAGGSRPPPGSAAYVARLRRTRSRTSGYLPSSRRGQRRPRRLGRRWPAGSASGMGDSSAARLARCRRRVAWRVAAMSSRYRAVREVDLGRFAPYRTGEERVEGSSQRARVEGSAQDWLPYSFSIVGCPEERHVDPVHGPRPAPAGGPRPAQGAAVLHARGPRLGAPRLRRLPRPAAQAAAPDRRRRHAGVPLLAARPRAHARLQPPDAADRGVPRPAGAAVLALDDAARPLDRPRRTGRSSSPSSARARRRPTCPTSRHAPSSSAPASPAATTASSSTRGLDDLPARAVAAGWSSGAMLADFPTAVDRLTDFLGRRPLRAGTPRPAS